MESEINAYFVKVRPNEPDSEDFTTSETMLRSHIGDNYIRHINVSEGYPLIASGKLTKRDVFVLDHFEGDLFKQLQQTASLIIGPRCLFICLLKTEPIPMGASPVYTTAMRDLKISASGITPQEKTQLSTKIEWMGGHYFQNFGSSITHLVSNTIKSSKYEYATLNGIPVMHVDWVQRVWERSLVDYISATDKEFDKYRLPIFFGTNITSTGLDTTQKNDVMRLVQENGGTYHRAFRSQLVDIVITEKGKTDSDKYQAAVRFKKDILSKEWIFDSIEKGFALPIKDYVVKSLKVSTPTKVDQSIADFTSTDHTQLSEISRISTVGTSKRSSAELTVNDTVLSAMNETHRGQQTPQKEMTFIPPAPIANTKDVAKNLQRDVFKKNMDASAQYRGILKDISPRKAKNAGAFLDGCCIYLSGFRTAEKEKLNRILNVGGATRYDAINDKITHIIVGQVSDADIKSWKKDGLRAAVHIVRLDWLLESIKLKQTANENIYRVSLQNSLEPDTPSPSSKKTLRSMNQSFKQSADTPSKKKLFEDFVNEPSESIRISDENTEIPIPRACSTEIPMEEDEHELLAHYSQENMPPAPTPVPLQTPSLTKLPPGTKPLLPHEVPTPKLAAPANNTELTSCLTIDYENLDFFRNLIIYVDKNQVAEDFYSQMQRECEAAQGNVINENFRDPVDYAIVSFERTFDISKLPVKAKTVITELYVESCMKENKLVPIEYYHRPIPSSADAQPLKGMTIVISIYTGLERDYIDSLAQLLGAKVNNNYSRKEYPLLICSSAEGAKYEGALKWHFPVVTSAWLVECAEQGVKLPTKPYLVGKSVEDFPPPSSLKKTISVDDSATCEDNFVTPLRNKRVSELANHQMARPSPPISNSTTPPPVTGSSLVDSPKTPGNSYKNAAYSIEFMEKILSDIEDSSDRECVRAIIEEIRANPTPELERIKRQVCTPVNRRMSYSPKVVSDLYSTPEFKRRMVEEFDKRWHLPTKKMKPSTPIEQIRKRVLRETCKNLGIPISDEDDDENNSPSSSRLATPVNTRRSTLVSSNKTSTEITPIPQRSSKSKIEPRSIFSDQAAVNRRTVDGSFIPNTQDAADNGQHRNTSTNYARPSLVGKSTIDFDKISFEETEVGGSSTVNAANNSRKSSTPDSLNSVARASPEVEQLREYMRQKEERRQSIRAAKIEAQKMNKLKDSEGYFLQAFDSEKPEAVSIDNVEWVDPIIFNKAKASKKGLRTMKYQGTPRFSISCSDDKQREEVIAKITRLGGEVSEDLLHFDPKCTHFVCERPNRGEKILGCISSGKWVLSLNYIEECHVNDNFIDEELFEWGNSKAIDVPEISTDDQTVAVAAHRRRTELNATENPNAGIFTGMRAILHINPRNMDSLGNVLRAGKGEVIAVTSPFSKNPNSHTATHCFVDVKKAPLKQADYNYLHSKGVKIASYMFIQAFILNGAEADLTAYEIQKN